MERLKANSPAIKGLGIAFIIVILLIGGTLFFSIDRLGVGYVAIVVDPLFGTTNIVGDGRSARYFFKTPWASVYKIYVATDSVDMWTDLQDIGDYPAIESLSKDGLKVVVDVTVRWSLSPSNVKSLFRRFPSLDWKERAIVPIIRESIRNTIVNYSAIDTIEKRSIVASEMRRELKAAFDREESFSKAVIFEALNLREMQLPIQFVEAIESKLSSEQLAIAAEFNRTKILIEANATAQSNILEAEGRARARILVSNATREAIDTIINWNNDVDRGNITNLYIYLETLRDITEKGKGKMIIVLSEEGEFIVPR